MTRFMRAQGFEDYDALWRWSVEDIPAFWRAVWDFFDVQAGGDPARVLASTAMPGAVWFPDVTLSYPEHIFRGKADGAVALHHASEVRDLDTWTWAHLRDRTARVRAGLRAMGVGRGDRVVAYMPNIPETLAATEWAAAWPATRSVPDRQGGAITMPGRPWHFSLDGTASEVQLPALQGEHNDEVLRELGYHAGEIVELREQNALVQPGRVAAAARQDSRAEVELVGFPPGVVA
jgi:hypothetical protein